MKYSKILILFILATIVFAACQKDEPRVNFALRVADQYTGGNSKVYMEGSTPVFIEDEEVRINGETYLIDYRSGSPAVYDVAQSASGAYYAIYPSSWVNGSASATPSITFPDMQEYRMEDGHQVIENPMVAYSTSGSTLNFYNVASLAKVQITNNYGDSLKIKYVALYTDNTPLSGPGTIDYFKTDTAKVRLLSGITNVSIDCSELPALANGETKEVTFALPPIKNVVLYVDVYMTSTNENTKYSFTKKTANGKTINRSEMGVIKVTLNNGSGPNDVKTCGLFWGSGSSTDDPFIIMDANDLKNLKNNITNSSYNASGIYYLQTANIDLTGQTGWTGIGDNNTPFKANYDGSGAWVKININDLSSTMPQPSGVGLFGNVGGGGEIKNLDTRGYVATQSRGVYVGGIVGKVSGAFTIDNCHNAVPLQTSSDKKTPYGGIVGAIIAGSGKAVTIKNCTNSASIKSNGGGHIGGICGSVYSGNVTFESDTNSGIISGTGTTDSCRMGGICGKVIPSTNTFENCVNSGDVTSEFRGTGGIVGFCSNEVHIKGINTRNTGSIKGGGEVGGIVGRAAKSMINETSGKTINEGTVTATNSQSSSFGAGGIIGNVNSNYSKNCINNCWNKGAVTTNGLAAGGIVGRVTQCKIDRCKNTGDIIVNQSTGDYSAAGGIVGLNYNGDNTNKTEISNCGTECKICTSDKIAKFCGGIIGYGRFIVEITNCYAIIEEMYGATGAAGIFGVITSNLSITSTTLNSYANCSILNGTKIMPIAYLEGSNGKITATNTYCNSNYVATDPSISTVTTTGYPTAYFSTSNGTATTGTFYGSATTLGNALRAYRSSLGADSVNYLPWMSGATPKLDWTSVFPTSTPSPASKSR